MVSRSTSTHNLLQAVARAEPSRRPARLTHSSFLLLRRHRDLAIPISCAARPLRTLRDAYRRAASGSASASWPWSAPGTTTSGAARAGRACGGCGAWLHVAIVGHSGAALRHDPRSLQPERLLLGNRWLGAVLLASQPRQALLEPRRSPASPVERFMVADSARPPVLDPVEQLSPRARTRGPALQRRSMSIPSGAPLHQAARGRRCWRA